MSKVFLILFALWMENELAWLHNLGINVNMIYEAYASMSNRNLINITCALPHIKQAYTFVKRGGCSTYRMYIVVIFC